MNKIFKLQVKEKSYHYNLYDNGMGWSHMYSSTEVWYGFGCGGIYKTATYTAISLYGLYFG